MQGPQQGMEPPASGAGGPASLAVNAVALKRAWESSQRVTKEDWAEWMRHFSLELLRESPSPALRACHSLAQVQPAMARELFPAAFVSCWSELDAPLQVRACPHSASGLSARDAAWHLAVQVTPCQSVRFASLPAHICL